ncbi:MAG: DUF371 domain-containing protein [Candidatus Woesearchaeota archaeon]
MSKIFAKFRTKGHENILGAHYNTLEFTKDKSLTANGDCIIGVDSDFDVNKLKELNGKIKIVLSVGNNESSKGKNKYSGTNKITDEIIAEINPCFDHKTEMVIRKSDFKDKRTFAINAAKAAKDVNRKLIEKMKNADAIMDVMIEKV